MTLTLPSHYIVTSISQQLEKPQRICYKRTPKLGANKLTHAYLPHEQIYRFPHDWLEMLSSLGYSYYNWVDGSGRVHQKC
jgi:hypothetical protein